VKQADRQTRIERVKQVGRYDRKMGIPYSSLFSLFSIEANFLVKAKFSQFPVKAKAELFFCESQAPTILLRKPMPVSSAVKPGQACHFCKGRVQPVFR
jgi:hypothetical protein